MSKRIPFIAGNWKMNKLQGEAANLVQAILPTVSQLESCEVAVCPPFTSLGIVANLVKDTRLGLGAQNCYPEDSGAFTGETAPPMLKDIGCQYVIVGHSERRTLYGESDQDVAVKFSVAQQGGLTPILCVGETLEEREAGDTEAVVARQIQAVIDEVGIEQFENSVIAYEPVWAIGTGKTATPEMAQEVHGFIRDMLSGLNSGIGKNLRILYGGSMNPGNAESLIAMKDIDGGLIGGASLQAESFLDICKAAN